MGNLPVNTIYIKDENLHLAEINPPQRNVLFVVEVIRYSAKEEIDNLVVKFWPKDVAQKGFEFNFADEVRDNEKGTRAIFVIPIEKMSMSPPYLVSISSDEDSVDLSDWKFTVYWGLGSGPDRLI